MKDQIPDPSINDRISITDFTEPEQYKFALLLKTYLPWLGTENEVDCCETVSELQNLYSCLPQIEEVKA